MSAKILEFVAYRAAHPGSAVRVQVHFALLWQFVAIFLAVGSAAFATAAYGLWWLQDLLKWAGL